MVKSLHTAINERSIAQQNRAIPYEMEHGKPKEKALLPSNRSAGIYTKFEGHSLHRVVHILDVLKARLIQVAFFKSHTPEEELFSIRIEVYQFLCEIILILFQFNNLRLDVLHL